MKQHCVTKEDVVDGLKKEVISAWKDINEEWPHTTQLAKTITDANSEFFSCD